MSRIAHAGNVSSTRKHRATLIQRAAAAACFSLAAAQRAWR